MADRDRSTAGELERLRRRLERERLARHEAEAIAERTTRELYAKITERTRELESLVAMGRDLATALDSHDVADVMAMHIARAAGFDECGIYMWDRPNNTVVTAGYFPAERRALLDAAYSLVEYPETGRVLIAQRLSVIRPDDPTADSSEVSFLRSLGGTLMIQLPILVGDRAVGTIELLSRSRQDLDDWQAALAQTMANEAGIMLENARLYAEVRHQAFHDPLTALPNRALFGDRLAHALARRRTSSQLVALLFVDMDDFKNINDTFGHEVGDQVLTAAARRLEGLMREGDTVARLSGDEFGILLEDVLRPLVADAVAARVVEAFQQPLEVGQRQIRLTVSVGVALGAASVHSAEDLIRNADFAMYAAKQSGKGLHRMYDASERMIADDRARLESDLRSAVPESQLRVHYQPIVDLRSGAITSLEALVRWQHPERGLLLPRAFVPMAEETDAIFDVGAWVLNAACEQLREWQRSHPALSVSVNLSGRQLQDPRMVAEVHFALARTGVDPSSLTLEVTETVLVADPTAEAVLLRLKALGVRLAIDDFGTGYSSISYLRRFPVDILKIDREFTRDVESAGGEALFRGIVQLGRSLGLQLVAEGIEQAVQEERVAAAGCALGQGYFLGRPTLSAGITTLLAATPRADRRRREDRLSVPASRPEAGKPSALASALGGTMESRTPARH
jgi:diguanylate cyclase (GGDEF)-like protein